MNQARILSKFLSRHHSNCSGKQSAMVKSHCHPAYKLHQAMPVAASGLLLVMD